jgi:hypothetical protein
MALPHFHSLSIHSGLDTHGDVLAMELPESLWLDKRGNFEAELTLAAISSWVLHAWFVYRRRGTDHVSRTDSATFLIPSVM